MPTEDGGTAWREISDPAVMAKQPLVSVKMLTYNHQPYIAQAIEGVLMQKTDFPVELVVGEDCSADRTREIVLGYQAKHPETIRVITSERNVGLSLNALRTERACRGQYLAYCEGDDYWHHPLKLQKQVEYLEAHPEVGLVFTGYDTLRPDTGRLSPWVPRPEGYDTRDNMFPGLLTARCGVGTVTVCVRKNLVDSVTRANAELTDPTARIRSTPMWLELLRVTSFKLINESMATYRELSESASRSENWETVLLHTRHNYDLRLHYIQKYDAPWAVERRVRHKYYEEFLRIAEKSSDRGLADSAWRELKESRAGIGLRQLVLYCGARYAAVRPGVRLFRLARRALRRKDGRWPSPPRQPESG